MSYEPTTWKAGDVVTSAKLNKLEQGVANGGVTVVNATVDGDTITLDKTAGEIVSAISSGVVYVSQANGAVMITAWWPEEGVGFTFVTAYNEFTAQTESDYPSTTDK